MLKFGMRFLTVLGMCLQMACVTNIGELMPSPRLDTKMQFKEIPVIIFGEQIFDEHNVIVPKGEPPIVVRAWKSTLKTAVANSLSSAKLASGAGPSRKRMKILRTDFDLMKVKAQPAAYYQLDLKFKMVFEGAEPETKKDNRLVYESVATSKMRNKTVDSLEKAVQRNVEIMLQKSLGEYLKHLN